MKKKHIDEEKIVDYILGYLSSDEHFRVTRHLKKCQKCTQNFQMWKNLLKGETMRVPSPETKKQLMKRTRFSSFQKMPRYTLSFALIVLLLFSVSLIGKTSKEEIAVTDEDTIAFIEENFRTVPMDIQQVHAPTLQPNMIIDINERGDFPIFSKDKIPDHYLKQLVFFQNGPLCTHDENEQTIICYTFDPITSKFYPIFIMK